MTTASGWYLYGITRSGSLPLHDDDELETLQQVEFRDLAAVVRQVPLQEFNAAALQERLQSPSALEAMVRSHNRVVEAIHRHRSILPAKLGLVHVQAESVTSGLREAHDSLLRQLERVGGCDEWAVHVYADRIAVRDRISLASPAIRRLREERAMARPGRAYFLEQQLGDAVNAATEQALWASAQQIFDCLATHAVDARVSPIACRPDAAGEEEILRASFLVRRSGAERFENELHASPAIGDGIRCDASGPWPPYSFAVNAEPEAM